MYLAIIILILLGSIVSGFFGRKVGVTGAQLITCSAVITAPALAVLALLEPLLVFYGNALSSFCIRIGLSTKSDYKADDGLWISGIIFLWALICFFFDLLCFGMNAFIDLSDLHQQYVFYTVSISLYIIILFYYIKDIIYHIQYAITCIKLICNIIITYYHILMELDLIDYIHNNYSLQITQRPSFYNLFSFFISINTLNPQYLFMSFTIIITLLVLFGTSMVISLFTLLLCVYGLYYLLFKDGYISSNYPRIHKLLCVAMSVVSFVAFMVVVGEIYSTLNAIMDNYSNSGYNGGGSGSNEGSKPPSPEGGPNNTSNNSDVMHDDNRTKKQIRDDDRNTRYTKIANGLKDIISNHPNNVPYASEFNPEDLERFDDTNLSKINTKADFARNQESRITKMENNLANIGHDNRADIQKRIGELKVMEASGVARDLDTVNTELYILEDRRKEIDKLNLLNKKKNDVFNKFI